MRQRLIHSETHLHAITSFNNLFQFALLPQRNSSKTCIQREQWRLRDSLQIPYHHHHPLSGLITTFPHCDAVTFSSDINIYVAKFFCITDSWQRLVGRTFRLCSKDADHLPLPQRNSLRTILYSYILTTTWEEDRHWIRMPTIVGATILDDASVACSAQKLLLFLCVCDLSASVLHKKRFRPD